MRKYLLSIIIILMAGCASTSEFIKSNDKINTATITNKFTELGYNCIIKDNSAYIYGPLYRDAAIVIESNKIKITTYSSYSYSEYINQIINSDPNKPLNLKSHLAFHGLNWLSPGFGLMYLSYNSIFWAKNTITTDLFLFLIDAFCIYAIFNNTNNSMYYALGSMVALRLSFSILGDTFITFDNNIYKIGYNIRF